MPELEHWDSFYVIVGSAGGALIGLQFVVMTLIAAARTGSSMREIRAFGTPTVMHFCAALLVSAVASAPWRELSGPALCLGACGAAGIVYSLMVIRHARRQTGYQPDVEDWIWFNALPLVAYAALLAAAILLPWHPTASLFVIAATSLLLLFVGIHNSWDTVTYIAVERSQAPKDGPDRT